MGLLGHNGVVSAAKLESRQGAPLIVLTDSLSVLPKGVVPCVDRIAKNCERLGALAAHCTNRMRVYCMFVAALCDITTRVAKVNLSGKAKLFQR